MENSIVANNLLNEKGYTPYCGSMLPRPPLGNGCNNPRTYFNGTQFVCPKCGWTSSYPIEFIEQYKKKWGLDCKYETEYTITKDVQHCRKP